MVEDRKRPTNIRIQPDSPYYRMSNKGYVNPGRLAMAKHLGRCIGSDEYIYYNDGNAFNLDINNMRLVGHKELNLLHQIRRTIASMEKLENKLATLRSKLATQQFRQEPCSCKKCMRIR